MDDGGGRKKAGRPGGLRVLLLVILFLVIQTQTAAVAEDAGTRETGHVLTGGKIAGMWLTGRNRKTYAPEKEIFGNPLMGYAPCAWKKEVGDDVSLLYVDITWRELEPEEGVFDWETIWRENQLDRWKREGKHVVLRFLCDLPGEEAHMDIPDWLYEKTGEQGDWYDMEYGCGFSPDYSNATLIRYHEKAVRAMGEKLGQDGLVSFVELGSLGHWGEWHVNYHAGIRRLPGEAVREQYVTPWLEAFPHAKVLMRRPFTPAARYGLGLYNDMTGDTDSTEEWLNWIRHGGDFEQTREQGALQPMKECWKTAPVGGEFTSSLSMKQMLDTRLDETLRLLKQSHVTFLGPKTADETYAEGYWSVLENMGYRLRISKAALRQDGDGAVLTLTWENDGAAPFCQNWQVQVYVEDKNGQITETRRVSLQLPELLPGHVIRTETRLESDDLTKKCRAGQRILIGIVDPMTGKDAVRLAMKAERNQGRTVLFD
ncbi:MAG: DUF4832 domain-containing protein [Eubacteriales bacterium]|nr:DUF4832 domain-containing protein [Eubacteriales bacterium]